MQAHWCRVSSLNPAQVLFLLQRAQLLKTAGLPVVYAEWLLAGKEAPTVLIYGHYGEMSAPTSSSGHLSAGCT